MKTVRTETLIDKGEFSKSDAWKKIRNDILQSIQSMEHPKGYGKFLLKDERGKERGKGSGVKPIRDMFVEKMEKLGWDRETKVAIAARISPGPLDVTIDVDKKKFGVEWETGNISSSHRAVNKLALGIVRKVLIGGALILPTRNMYKYLTDRVGNFEELEPYFPLWRSLRCDEGLLMVIAVEHDAVSKDVPRIQKGTNGRALA